VPRPARVIFWMAWRRRCRTRLRAVDLVFDLEVAAHALRINVVGDGRAAEFDGSAQDGLQGGAQADEFGASEAASLAARTDAGAEERLVGVDVANAVEQRLVQQRGLDRRLAARKSATKSSGEIVRGSRPGRSKCPLTVVRCPLFVRMPGLAGGWRDGRSGGVNEADFAVVGESEHGVGVRRLGTSGGETSKRPVMPRWMRNSVGAGFFCLPRSTVITMVLPTRRTLSTVAPVSALAISASGDLNVCGLPLVHTAAMRAPWTRAWTPLRSFRLRGVQAYRVG